jgi:hypothetical protein
MGKVLGIVYRTLATHITKKAGNNKKTAQTGAVTLIQRFGSALNLNIHFHMLYLDGVYAEDNYGKTRFEKINRTAMLTSSQKNYFAFNAYSHEDAHSFSPKLITCSHPCCSLFGAILRLGNSFN